MRALRFVFVCIHGFGGVCMQIWRPPLKTSRLQCVSVEGRRLTWLLVSCTGVLYGIFFFTRFYHLTLYGPLFFSDCAIGGRAARHVSVHFAAIDPIRYDTHAFSGGNCREHSRRPAWARCPWGKLRPFSRCWYESFLSFKTTTFIGSGLLWLVMVSSYSFENFSGRTLCNTICDLQLGILDWWAQKSSVA